MALWGKQGLFFGAFGTFNLMTKKETFNWDPYLSDLLSKFSLLWEKGSCL